MINLSHTHYNLIFTYPLPPLSCNSHDGPMMSVLSSSFLLQTFVFFCFYYLFIALEDLNLSLQVDQNLFNVSIQVQPEWDTLKIDVMYRVLKCKFSIYPHLNSMLLSTAGSVLVEASPHDLFWGGGREGEGLNYLGRLLMQLRSEFLGEPLTPSHTFS